MKGPVCTNHLGIYITSKAYGQNKSHKHKIRIEAWGRYHIESISVDFIKN